MDSTLDDRLRALSHGHRRRTLLALLDGDSNGAGFDASGRIEPADGDRDAACELRHVHLPMLADMKFIDWSRTDGDVTRGPRFDEIEPLLAVLSENRERLSVDGALEFE
ncbi:hypothetical protein ACFQGT_02460 [Natrialbaceae archaeon GCM10025810]|uniref:hypothetical protein n=1 Tax=Halovalidus salilacus TaxID=3075124 RepID=UPI003612B32F